jgi:ferritin
MLKKVIQDSINAQINSEMYSGYLYLSMSAYCESINLKGFAHWLKVQGQEEWGHAMKFYDYIFDRGGKVSLQAIAQPPEDFKSPLELFQQVLEHEKKITEKINKLYELAIKENDYATVVRLQWFITEQVEEEKNAGEIVDQLKVIKDNFPGLMMLDRHLSARSAGH